MNAACAYCLLIEYRDDDNWAQSHPIISNHNTLNLIDSNSIHKSVGLRIQRMHTYIHEIHM